MKRPRTKLTIPRTPGGHLDNPPLDCPNQRSYNPNPAKYETIMVVDYCLCERKYCKLERICERRVEEDSGRARRINRMRNGNGGE